MDRVKIKCMGLRMVSERTISLPYGYVLSAVNAAAIATHLIADRPVEHLIAILVNTGGLVTGVTTLSQGGASKLSVRTVDILRAVLVGHAAGFVLAHNHPSGDPNPTPEDIEFTRAIARGAEVVGVRLLDHVIVVPGGDFRCVPVPGQDP